MRLLFLSCVRYRAATERHEPVVLLVHFPLYSEEMQVGGMVLHSASPL
eukprot:SAG11_NODE_19374_length_468_cov_0.693767_1_plen_47_part_10